jgi:phosphatidate cytidylyltransferase
MGMALGRDSFTDLSTRILTGVAIAVVGLGAVWAGSPWFTIFVAASSACWSGNWRGCWARRGTGRWALARRRACSCWRRSFCRRGSACRSSSSRASSGSPLLPRNRTLFLVISVLIMLASFGLITHRDTFGLTWMLWLVLVVAITDIGGYFAGRIIGGPKFWPRVSPKKTWSGTVAGWVGAGVVGWASWRRPAWAWR